MPRILLIGIDGFSLELVRQWADDGYLPHLREMLAVGSAGPLRSTPEFSSPQAWPSLITGVNPAKHGIFSFLQPVPGTYEVRRMTSADIQVPTIFSLLSAAGSQLACLNIPCTYPMEELSGVGVAGWLCPSLRHNGATWPPELAGELRQRFGRYPFHAEIKHYALQGRYDQAVNVALAQLHKKSEIGKYLYRRQSWDLFAIAFVETDAIQHYFWHLCDPSHPEYDPDQVDQWGNPVLRIYQAIDEIIGQWRELASDDTIIIIASDHGASLYNRGRTYMPNLLRAAGLTVDKSPRLGTAVAGLGRKLGERLHQLLPKAVKMRLYNNPLGRRAVESFFSRRLTENINWEQTQAYSYYWETAPWVNLRGRQPQGIVAPGDQYEQIRQQLIELISSAADAVTGQPAASRVFRREELYSGPHLDVIPDIGVWWNQKITLEGPLIADFEGRRLKVKPAIPVPGITGGHAPDGTVIVHGPGVRSAAKIEHARIEDIAPTLLTLLDQPVPDYMDGAALNECFTEPLPVGTDRAAEMGADERRQGPAYSPDEEDIIRDRLRDLGYL